MSLTSIVSKMEEPTIIEMLSHIGVGGNLNKQTVFDLEESINARFRYPDGGNLLPTTRFFFSAAFTKCLINTLPLKYTDSEDKELNLIYKNGDKELVVSPFIRLDKFLVNKEDSLIAFYLFIENYIAEAELVNKN